MASSPGPATPEDTPKRLATVGRSFTLPAKASTPTKSVNTNPEIGSTEGIETLYHHPNAKLVKFTTTSRSGAAIPWESPTERTIAAGELQIYRVPGSVSFLRSGTVLHTIMTRSNCWCVDGVSKFVLRILMDTYYRIELPAETEEDLEHVEKFKVTLQKVCYYERTPCPFARTFSVDLPDQPEVIRKGKRRKSTGPAKKWKLDRVWRPEGWVEPEKVSEESASGSGSPAGSDDESDTASTPMEAEDPADEVKPMTPSTPMRQRALASLRSASAPQSPAPLSTPPSRLRTRVDVDGTIEVSEGIPSTSSGPENPRLRTFHAIPTDMPPSPPDSSAGIESNDGHTRGGAEAADEQSRGPMSDGNNDTRTQLQRDGATIDGNVQYYDGLAEDQNTHSRNINIGHTAVAIQPIQNLDSERQDISETDHDNDQITVPVDESLAKISTNAVSRRTANLEIEAQTSRIACEDTAPAIAGILKTGESMSGLTDETPAAATSYEEATREIDVESSPEQKALTNIVEPQSTPVKTVEFVPEEEYDGPSRLQTPQALQSAVEFVGSDEILPADSGSSELLSEEADDDRPRTPPDQTAGEDPYAAIQARIMARRSLSGTISFHPSYKSPTRQSTSSTSSIATISSSRSTLSRRSQSSQQQQAFASAMVKRAYNTFLGPPAHLVAIMLQIAARFANGAFGVESMFYVASPTNSPRKVPGSYQLSGNGVEELDSDFEVEDEEDEDDFGVPLNSPVRLVSRTESNAGGSVRERRGWDVD